jgi:hypothetical protein
MAPLLLLLLTHQPSDPPSLARYRAFAESSAARQSWSETGAIMGGVGGALVFAAAFYHFTHRSGSGAVNNTTGTFGGTLVGAAGGAAGGALFGAFIGSLVPRHRAKH